MLVRIIGGHGGVAPGFHATSYLIDGKLLIDAGSCATGLLIEEQVSIENILISHPHLDHIKDLAFICDNCFGLKEKPFEVYTNSTVVKAIKDHLMNETIWPDFSKLPNEKKPTIRFNTIEKNKPIQLGNYSVTPVSVNHPGDGMGFLVERGGKGLLFTQDTGPTDKIWEMGKKMKSLKAIFTEVSFPNHMQSIATLSQHHTPQSMMEEMKKMPGEVPIFLGHIKPNYQKELFQEINDLDNERFHILGMDETSYVF